MIITAAFEYHVLGLRVRLKSNMPVRTCNETFVANQTQILAHVIVARAPAIEPSQPDPASAHGKLARGIVDS